MHSTQTPLARSRFKSREKLRRLHQVSCTFGWPRVYLVEMIAADQKIPNYLGTYDSKAQR
jgi:transposase